MAAKRHCNRLLSLLLNHHPAWPPFERFHGLVKRPRRTCGAGCSLWEYWPKRTLIFMQILRSGTSRAARAIHTPGVTNAPPPKAPPGLWLPCSVMERFLPRLKPRFDGAISFGVVRQPRLLHGLSGRRSRRAALTDSASPMRHEIAGGLPAGFASIRPQIEIGEARFVRLDGGELHLGTACRAGGRSRIGRRGGIELGHKASLLTQAGARSVSQPPKPAAAAGDASHSTTQPER